MHHGRGQNGAGWAYANAHENPQSNPHTKGELAVLTHPAYGRKQQPLHPSPQKPQTAHSHWPQDNVEKWSDTKQEMEIETILSEI